MSNSTATSSGQDGHDLESPYNYVPTLWVCATLLALFAFSGLLHLIQAIWTRKWWLLPTLVLCAIGEIIGWSGRLWSSKNVLLGTPFLIQISTTIIAPSFMSAALFVTLGHLVTRLGPQYSRLGPKLYTIIFCTVDLISLVVQAVGGGLASSADTHEGAENGGHIMLGGIIIQMIAITFYALLALEFFARFYTNRPVRNVASNESPEAKAFATGSQKVGKSLKLLILGLGLSSLFLFIRAVYRTIELSDGWNGRIISTQTYFNVLDGLAVFAAMLTLNVLHPGYLLSRVDSTQLSPVGSTV
ncbi:hypothetical protein BOTBODRAFT_37144 [Botryobasidium botryosum FD-172 SS1]|uniref:RTA1 like protein n=1 Tax=Botryobasidium botryosum (strain FD-172 SS1) TaxID=930990 RepID=A0A067M0H7_BOTB1|nr:hypothetical protein BOTBODRAFT_37144 [Botryobasidium botryosum FD-172 SS1]